MASFRIEGGSKVTGVKTRNLNFALFGPALYSVEGLSALSSQTHHYQLRSETMV